MFRILCVEDANDTIEILSSTLYGYEVSFAKTVKEALDQLESKPFELVLLDIELPDGSGFEILAHLQSKRKNLPVICLTGKKDFSSKVSAFSLGADDFVQKPFDHRELRLRVDSKLRKVDQNKVANDRIYIGDLTCILQEQRLRNNLDGRAIDLTSHEFRIFRLLAKTPNKIFTREEILDRIWTDTVSVTDRTIDVHISNLRKKIQGSQVTIETVIGAGYRIATKTNATPSTVKPAQPSPSRVPVHSHSNPDIKAS
jgi:DNA-binding response OmpR family regulator